MRRQTRGRRAEVAKNGNNARSIPPDAGAAMQRLDKPEEAGTISVAEAGEIRERTRIREAYEALFKTKKDELDDLAKVMTIIQMESFQFQQKLIRDRGLSLNDNYDIRSDTGIIWRTARSVPPQAVEVTDTEPVTVPTAEE